MKQKMYLAQIARTVLCLTLIIFISFVAVSAQTTAFTYQGRFTDSALPQPTNGTYQMQFALFDAGNTPVGAEITVSSVRVMNGIFTVPLDFGANAFAANEERQLEIRVFNSATSAYVTLSPRQRLTSAPFAIRALKATTADISTDTLNVNGTPSNQIIKEGDARLTDSRTPTAGSGDYVQNMTTEQSATNFNISGTGAANVFNARTQFNINGERVFSTPGFTNTFAGNYAGANNPGSNNSFFGREAGAFSLTGTSNAFFGSYTGRSSQGNANSFFGDVAGVDNGTGSQNVFIGFLTGGANRSGSSNTLLGARANVGSGDLNFATAIGAGATVSDSNSVVLGRTLDTVRIPGTLNVNTFTAAALSANTVNADTQFNIGGSRVFSASGLNTFVGLLTGSGGAANSFFGNEAGRFTNGSLNSFFGSGAGLSNLSGGENSFFGRSAGVSNISGYANSFFGLNAGSDNTTGNNNSFFGVQAGIATTTGSDNLFFGRDTGFTNKTGSNNTLVGSYANVTANNLNFATALGAGAVVGTNNTIVLGRADGSDKVRIFGLGTGGTTALCRNADNEISTCAPINLTEENRDTIEQINMLREQLKAQQIVIDSLKKLVCANNSKADVCQ